MTRDELRAVQWSKLSAGLDLAFVENPFYRTKFADQSRSSITSLDDVPRLPFTTKEELLADQEARPPYGTNLTFPISRYTRLHQSSGTSGRKLRWLDTPESWSWVLDCWNEIYAAVGLNESDRLFFPFSFGPFLGFWAAFEGASRLGRFALPGGGMTTVARLQAIFDHSITIVCCTPTYALRMAEVAKQEGIRLVDSSVRALIVAGEPGGSIPATRRRIEEAWNARVIDHSGMTEIGSLGIEFADQPGKLFLLETQTIAEFIDPQSFAPVAEGQLGELVLTNLGRWGSPLIRYRTGDLVRWRRDVEPKGFPFVHLEGGILGRTDDMLWIKGNNVYPSAIEAVVCQFPEVCEFSIEKVERGGANQLLLQLEPQLGFVDATLADRVCRAVQDELNFRPEVNVLTPGSLPKPEWKANRLKSSSQ